MKLKENQSIKPVIDVDAGTVTFIIRDREPLTLTIGKLHPDVVKRAALVGMAQVRIVDAAAISATDDDGNLLDAETRLDTKRERMEALVEHYETGTPDWSRKGTGEGGGRSITLEAIARVKSVDYETAKAMVARMAEKAHGGDTKKALAFLRTGRKIAEAVNAIRAERAPAPKIDADNALKDL